MKAIASLLALLSIPAYAGPVSLLDCYLDYIPLQSVTVSAYAGRLFLLTNPADGNGSSRILDEKEWDRRILILSDTPELKGVLYQRDGEWLFSFKDSAGWRTSGNAVCSGSNGILQK